MLKLGLVKHPKGQLPLNLLIQTQELLRAEGLLPSGGHTPLDPRRLDHALHDACRHRGGPVFGLFLAEQLLPNVLSRMSHLLLCADHLLMAMRTLSQHSNGLGLITRIRLANDDNHYRVIADHRAAPPERPELATELVLGLLWLVLSRYGTPLQDPVDVHISHTLQGDAKRYQTFFGPYCTVHFNQPEDCLRFSHRDFIQLNPQRDPELYAALSQLVEQNFPTMAHSQRLLSQDWLVRVRVEMLAQLEQGRGCTVDSVAENLHLTPRTLQRKLEGYQLTYSAVLDQCRREKAVQLLADESLPPKMLATKLGFASVQSLRRAALRWFGALPPALASTPTRDQRKAGA